MAPDRHRMAVAFSHVLRRCGLPVPTDATVAFAQALGAVGLARPQGVYWAGRATLVRRPEHVGLYDQAFAAFFGRESPAEQTPPGLQAPVADLDGASAAVRALRWSPTEVLRHQDLATCTDQERDEAHRLIHRLRVEAAQRRSRRRRPARARRGRLDLGTTLRRARRTGGEVLRPAFTRPGVRRRRVVLLLDVSGSMEPYARAFTRFAHAAVAAGGVEVFTLGTRVHRITRELSTHDPDEALAQATEAVVDWSGGTRLGADLRWFNDRWGVRGLARGATVVVVSDGWDRGDPTILEAELVRLRRVVHRLIWVNPLKASPGYAPLAQGMAAALPHLDEFLEGHSVASLEELVQVVAQ